MEREREKSQNQQKHKLYINNQTKQINTTGFVVSFFLISLLYVHCLMISSIFNSFNLSLITDFGRGNIQYITNLVVLFILIFVASVAKQTIFFGQI